MNHMHEPIHVPWLTWYKVNRLLNTGNRVVISDIWCNLLHYSLLPAIFTFEVERQFYCNDTQEGIDQTPITEDTQENVLYFLHTALFAHSRKELFQVNLFLDLDETHLRGRKRRKE